MANTRSQNAQDFAQYQQKIFNNLGYFAMSRSRVVGTKRYYLEDNSACARAIYWLFYTNTTLKAIFLAFLVAGYFGSVEFLDKIAALDYILCVGIVTFGSCIWFSRYPFYEILHAFWKVEKAIFAELGYPEDLKLTIDKRHHATVWIHLAIVWIGCFILLTQFYSDPKYCVWTYSAFQIDTWYLRVIFCLHEFIFMMHPWNNMTGSSSLCTFQGIALSNIINIMTEALENTSFQKHREILTEKSDATSTERIPHPEIQRGVNNTNLNEKFSFYPGPSTSFYDTDKMLSYYKQLILISEQFNSWVSYKIVFLHACGYCQFISDVFVAIQVLKLEGTGIMDVWFYIEDSLASMYMIYRVYTFMSRVKPASDRFLRALNFQTLKPDKLKERKRLLKVIRTLRPVSLKLGPCPVTPMTVLQALDMLSNYYVCVALWH